MSKMYYDFSTSMKFAKVPAGFTKLCKYYRKIIHWHGRTYHMAPDTLSPLYEGGPTDKPKLPSSYQGIAINHKGWHYDVEVKSNDDGTAPSDKVISLKRRRELDDWRESDVELHCLTYEKRDQFFEELNFPEPKKKKEKFPFSVNKRRRRSGIPISKHVKIPIVYAES